MTLCVSGNWVLKYIILRYLSTSAQQLPNVMIMSRHKVILSISVCLSQSLSAKFLLHT